jgi:uncharacterized protein
MTDVHAALPSNMHFSHGLSAHWQTVYPFIHRGFKNLFRTNKGQWKTIPSSDGYLIPFRAWTAEKGLNSQKELFILSHGLEGSAESGYIQDCAHELHQKGFDVWAWYMRGCSKIDSGPLLYNSGFTIDLRSLIEEAKKLTYKRIHLIGFSVGGNITLKLLGEGVQGISSAVCFSTPLHLEDVAQHLSKSFGGFYMKRFLKSLKEKIGITQERHPNNSFKMEMLHQCHDFESFDAHFTAPMHRFQSAHDYYTQCSSLFSLPNIRVKCLVVSACNDPFLTPSCFPNPANYPHIDFQYPLEGGHCGFQHGGKPMVTRALEFIAQSCKFTPHTTQ